MDQTSPTRHIALRIILLLVGVAIAMIGVSTGFGGIKTLGLQVSPDFIEIADAEAFAVQDNHARFLGGFWLGAGLLFIAAGYYLAPLKTVLIALLSMGFLGGLVRFSALDMGLLFGPDIFPPLAMELIGFPLLAFWIHRSVQADSTDR
ncbi:MAG: DUF4345 domain-containing protein [Kordiimonadaceae bacterium]|nr:DUF4345 domain-containing protein [Kordiimonadaceae bacterium]MBO6567660.1 DUF4345 domain-containing protein [Kordiimonadaceae bacterium]MBO6963126.1 DUF4345 domain-containing protein [Kordiimonadaceae bacterium]